MQTLNACMENYISNTVKYKVEIEIVNHIESSRVSVTARSVLSVIQQKGKYLLSRCHYTSK